MKYTWKATGKDTDWTDGPVTESGDSILFDTQEECYKHMRSAALGKMKWNTEWEDFECVHEGENGVETSDISIGYDVKFYPDRIVHTSYSGEYVYEIVIANA